MRRSSLLQATESDDCNNINELEEHEESAVYHKVKDFSYRLDTESEIQS